MNGELRRLETEGAISKKSAASLRVMADSSRPPLIYGRVKLHKEGEPLRPIVSAVGSCTYKVAKAVARAIMPYGPQVELYIRNSGDLVDIVRDLRIQEDEVMVSVDMRSLFTSVAVEDALTTVRKRLDDDNMLQERCGFASETVMRLLKLCLSTYFKFRSKFYDLTDGLAMGSPVSPPVANLFMADLESKALKSFSGVPSVWCRYVDDVLSIVKRSLVKDFFDHLNSQHGGISFTVEVEREGRLHFMDVLLQRRENGTISTDVYQKPTHMERYLQFDSHHPLGAKRAIFGALARRLNYVSREEDKVRELEHIKSVLMENRYPRALVEAWSRQKKRTTKGGRAR